jgi:hypothetical protein
MEPLIARCRSCDARVALIEIAERQDGRCPGCGEPFSPGWTNLLVQECEAIDQLVNALVRSLRRLTGLPGTLELEPETLVMNLMNDVPWGRSIDTEPALVATAIEAFGRTLDEAQEGTSRIVGADVRTLASKLLNLAMVLDANQEATEPSMSGAGEAARLAAAQLDEVAADLDRGTADHEDLRVKLEAAARTT